MGLNLEQVNAFLLREFPQNTAEVVSVEEGMAILKQAIDHEHLRPGETVSGPTMMALADCAMYVAIQATIGPVTLAVTTSFNINFLHRPLSDKDIMAEAKLIKVGKRLVIGDVRIYSGGRPEPVAAASATYSIP